MIRRTCLDDREVLLRGLDFHKNHPFEVLLEVLKGLDHRRQLCVLANMIEVAMSDGVLHSVERRLIRRFLDVSTLTEEERQTVRDVLLVKNQISVPRGS